MLFQMIEIICHFTLFWYLVLPLLQMTLFPYIDIQYRYYIVSLDLHYFQRINSAVGKKFLMQLHLLN